MTPSKFTVGACVTSLTYAAEAASSKTLEALAQVIRALAPEVSGVSFHDFAADTLWMSEDFILPEDHQLVEDSLSSDSGGNLDVSYAPREDGNYSSPFRCAMRKARSTARCA